MIPVPAEAAVPNTNTALLWCQHAGQGQLGHGISDDRRCVVHGGGCVGLAVVHWWRGRDVVHLLLLLLLLHVVLHLLHAHVGPDSVGRLDRGSRDVGTGGEHTPCVDGGRQGRCDGSSSGCNSGSHGVGGMMMRSTGSSKRLLRPEAAQVGSTGVAGQKGRLAEDLDRLGRWWCQSLEEGQDVGLDLIALAAKQLAGTVFLKTLEGSDMCAVHVLVDGLNKVVVHLLGLLLLLGPVKRVGLVVDGVDVLVVLDKGLDGVRGQLKGDLVAQDHVDVDNVGLDGDELVVEKGLNERVGILAQLGFGGLGDHERCQCPDGVFGGQGLGEAALVLGHTVEWALDPVDALESLGKPWFDLGAQDDVDGGSTGSEGGGGRR